MDLSATIIPKSDQLNAEDLLAGPITVTVESVSAGNAEQPVDIHLVEYPGRAYRPSKTMRRVIVKAWGKESDAYTGRRMTLYRDPEVKFGGQRVGGIKVSHLSHIDRGFSLALTETRGKRTPHTVEPLPDAPAPNVQQRPTTRPTPGDDLLTAFNQAGITDKTDRLRFASEAVGRELKAAADLTTDEAARVVDALKALTGGAA